MQATIGYNSRGLSKSLTEEGTNVSAPLRGFFISGAIKDGSDFSSLFSLNSTVSLSGSALRGSIGVGAAIDFNTSISLGSGRVYLVELIDNSPSSQNTTITTAGQVVARLYVFVDTWLYSDDWTLLKVDILTWGDQASNKKPDPVLSHIRENEYGDDEENKKKEKVLVINAG